MIGARAAAGVALALGLVSGLGCEGSGVEGLPQSLVDAQDAVSDEGPETEADADADAGEEVEAEASGGELPPDVPEVSEVAEVEVTDAADAETDAGPEEVEITPIYVPGDDCTEPLVIPADDLPFEETADSKDAADDYSLAGGCGTGGDIGKGAGDVVFTFTPEISGFHVIGLSPATLSDPHPSVVYIATDCEDVANSCVAVSSDLSLGGIMSAYMEAGTTYYVVVDGLLKQDVGPFTLLVIESVCVPQCPGPECGKDGCGGFCGFGCAEGQACAPDGLCVDPFEVPGNVCPTAWEIESVPFAQSGDTWYGDNQYSFEGGACEGEPLPFGATSRDHIYTLIPEDSGIYQLQLVSEFDGALVVTKSCMDASAFCEAAADETLGVENLELWLEAGEYYFVIVEGASNIDDFNGQYTLFVSEPCIPDCEGAECGGDGCGGTCGGCQGGEVCEDHTCVAAPTGDHCSNPFVVEGLPFVDERDSSVFQADYHTGYGDCPGVLEGWGKGSSDVVYAFSPPEDQWYTMSVDASFDSLIYIVTDCEDIGGTCLAAADANITGEAISLELFAGETYFIVVDGYGNISNPSGPYTFALNYACVPDCEGKSCGDDGCGGSCGQCSPSAICDEAQQCQELLGNSCVLPFEIDSSEGLPVTVEGETTDATNALALPYDACGPAETAVRGAKSHDEVWAFTPEVSAVYTLTLTADFGYSLYVVNNCENFEKSCFIEQPPDPLAWFLVANECKDWEGHCAGTVTGVNTAGSTLELPVWLDAGVTWYIVVDGNANTINYEGTYTLTIAEPCFPECEGKQCGDNGCGLPCGECAPGLKCDEAQQCVEQEGNACFTPWTIAYEALPYETEGDTTDATNAYGVPSYACEDASGGQKTKAGAGSRDEIYVFTPPEDGLYEGTLTSVGWESALYVLEAGCEDYYSTCFFTETEGIYSWTAVVPGCSTFQQTCLMKSEGFGSHGLEVELIGGTSYFIVVDGETGLDDSYGAYTFTWDEACEPQCEDKACGDDGCGGDCGPCPGGFVCDPVEFVCIDQSQEMGNTCENAWVVKGVPFLATGNTSDKSSVYSGCGGGEEGRDEIWEFTPTQSGVYVVSVTPEEGFAPTIGVMSECVTPEFTCVEGTTIEALSAALEAGTTYHIKVDGQGSSQDGTYVLKIELP